MGNKVILFYIAWLVITVFLGVKSDRQRTKLTASPWYHPHIIHFFYYVLLSFPGTTLLLKGLQERNYIASILICSPFIIYPLQRAVRLLIGYIKNESINL